MDLATLVDEINKLQRHDLDIIRHIVINRYQMLTHYEKLKFEV